MQFRVGIIEFILFQLIIYTLIWLYSEYIGFFITITFPILITAIFIISLIVEWIEPSKVPKAYFSYMIFSILAPVAVLVFFTILHGGHWDWMDQLAY